MKKYLAFYETLWPANIAELTAVKNKPFVGYLKGEGVLFTVVPEPVTGPADNEIWYTSSNGNVVAPNNTDAFEVNIVSNTYENGKGIITFDGDVTSIGKNAFEECESLTSITIPNSVTSIGNGVFSGCGSLTSITIPNNVTSIGNYAFSSCSSLTSISIPNSVTSIGYNAFSGCGGLISITISESVTSIEEYVFSNCSRLTSISIPNSVTSIGDGAFEYCGSLTSISIPNSVISIANYAFDRCSALTSITYEGTQAQWNAITKGSDWSRNIPATYVQCSDGQAEL